MQGTPNLAELRTLKEKKMADNIASALTGFQTSLESVASTVLPIGAAALLVWLGWRLACKIPNRGVGK